MSSLTIRSSTDSSPRSSTPILLTNNKEEKSAHITSSDDENIPARFAAVHVDISTSNSQTDVSEVSVGQCMIVVVTSAGI